MELPFSICNAHLESPSQYLTHSDSVCLVSWQNQDPPELLVEQLHQVQEHRQSTRLPVYRSGASRPCRSSTNRPNFDNKTPYVSTLFSFRLQPSLTSHKALSNAAAERAYYQQQQYSQDRAEEAHRSLANVERALGGEAEARILEDQRIATQAQRTYAAESQRLADESRQALHGIRHAGAAELHQGAFDAQQAMLDAQRNVAWETQRQILDTQRVVTDAERDVALQTNRHIADTSQAVIDAQRAAAAETREQVAAVQQAALDTRNEVHSFAREHVGAAQSFLGGAQTFLGGFVDGGRKAYAETRSQFVHSPRTPEDEAQRLLTHRAIHRDSTSHLGITSPLEAHTRSPAPNPEPPIHVPLLTSASRLPSSAAVQTGSGNKTLAAFSPLLDNDVDRPGDPYKRLSVHRNSPRPPDPYRRWSTVRDREGDQAAAAGGSYNLSDGGHGRRLSEHGEVMMAELASSPRARRRQSTLVEKQEAVSVTSDQRKHFPTLHVLFSPLATAAHGRGTTAANGRICIF